MKRRGIRPAYTAATGVLGSLTFLVMALTSVAFAQRQSDLTVSDQSLKAAYIYKFANYVEWPEGALEATPSPITIGVVGADALGEELTAITAERRIDARPISIRRLPSADAVDGVHILFLGQQDRDELGRDLGLLGSRPILTVTDISDGLTTGSVVNFTSSNNRVRFEISLVAAEQTGLRLDARLLGVAERVLRRDQ
jgi:hypothetical protein